MTNVTIRVFFKERSISFLLLLIFRFSGYSLMPSTIYSLGTFLLGIGIVYGNFANICSLSFLMPFSHLKQIELKIFCCELESLFDLD